MIKRIINSGNLSVWIGIATGALYGLGSRFLFTSSRFQDVFDIMTIGFIFLGPFTHGILTVYFGEWYRPRGWLYRLFMPWVSCILLLLVAFLVGWEGSICLLMALPIFLMMASLGGLFTGLVLQASRSRQNTY